MIEPEKELIDQFFAFIQKHYGLFLNTKQELVARLLFKEPRFMELLLTPRSGKSTLFDLFEAFAHRDPNYPTREELFVDRAQLIEANKEITVLKKEVDSLKEDVAGLKKEASTLKATVKSHK